MALITLPVTFVAGQQLPAASLNVDLTTIYNDYNGNITNANIAAAAAIALSKININAFAFNLQAAASNTWASGTTGDTVPRLTMNSNGELVAGPGGVGVLDIGLRRSAVNTWQLYVPGGGTPVLLAGSLTLSVALTAPNGGTGLTTSGVDATKALMSDGAGGFVMATPASGGGFTIFAKAANFAVSDGPQSYYRISATATATLPASPADGSVRKFKVTGGTTTFAFNGADTINHADGTSDQSLTLVSASGVLELIAVTAGWDET